MKLAAHIKVLKLYIRESKNKNCRQKNKRLTREIDKIYKKHDRREEQ